jgi:hypothetical protein
LSDLRERFAGKGLGTRDILKNCLAFLSGGGGRVLSGKGHRGQSHTKEDGGLHRDISKERKD